MHAVARHAAHCRAHAVLHLTGRFGDGVAVAHHQININDDLAVLHFGAHAAQSLFARELLRDLLGHILAHGTHALDLADGVRRDGGDHVLRNMDAAVFLGTGQILSIFSHSDISPCLKCYIKSILPSSFEKYNS